MDECELVSLVTAIACTIAKVCSANEIDLMAAVFTQLGDTLATISIKREICEKTNKAGDTDVIEDEQSKK